MTITVAVNQKLHRFRTVQKNGTLQVAEEERRGRRVSAPPMLATTKMKKT